MALKKIIINFVLLFSLAGCVASYRTEVVRFHDFSQPHGTKVMVQPGQGVSDGPEFRQYADMVIGQLAAHGYGAAGEAEPDVIVEVSYGVIRHEAQLRRHPWRASLYFGHLYANPYYRYYNPYYYTYWDFPEDYYIPAEHERILEVIIKTKDEKVLFEGRAVSVGRTSQLVEVMPYLSQALFKGFPGISGEIVNVSIREEDLLAQQ